MDLQEIVRMTYLQGNQTPTFYVDVEDAKRLLDEVKRLRAEHAYGVKRKQEMHEANAELEQKIERLQNQLETERGHRQADNAESRQEIERLKAKLRETYSHLAWLCGTKEVSDAAMADRGSYEHIIAEVQESEASWLTQDWSKAKKLVTATIVRDDSIAEQIERGGCGRDD